jgi:hypothetical protein
MNDDQRGFFRNLLQGTLQAAIMGVIWRLPTWLLVTIIVGIIAVIMWFGLY